MHLRSVKHYVNGKEGCHEHTHVTFQMKRYGTRKVNGKEGPNYLSPVPAERIEHIHFYGCQAIRPISA